MKLYCHECLETVSPENALRIVIPPAERQVGIDDPSYDDPRCPMCGEYLSDETFACDHCGDWYPLTNMHKCEDKSMCGECHAEVNGRLT